MRRDLLLFASHPAVIDPLVFCHCARRPTHSCARPFPFPRTRIRPLFPLLYSTVRTFTDRGAWLLRGFEEQHNQTVGKENQPSSTPSSRLEPGADAWDPHGLSSFPLPLRKLRLFLRSVHLLQRPNLHHGKSNLRPAPGPSRNAMEQIQIELHVWQQGISPASRQIRRLPAGLDFLRLLRVSWHLGSVG